MEQHKQKEVCKAQASAKGTSTAARGDAEHKEDGAVFEADTSGLRKMEQLVQQLLPPPSTSLSAATSKQHDQGSKEQPPDEQQGKDQQPQQAQEPSDHGPKLPKPPPKGRHVAQSGPLHTTALQPQLDAAAELGQLVRASSACCIYLRVCGGLKAAVSVLVRYVAQQQQQQQQQQLCAATVALLNGAVDNDGNLFKLAEEPGFVAAALALLHW